MDAVGVCGGKGCGGEGDGSSPAKLTSGSYHLRPGSGFAALKERIKRLARLVPF